jgi:hypothetical protein
MNLYGTCELERNPVLKAMCREIGYNAVWVWLPIEATVIAASYEGFKKIREAQALGAYCLRFRLCPPLSSSL